jgi:hypothetical protein
LKLYVQSEEIQDVARRDPALRQPPIGQYLPQMPRIGPIGLGVSFPAPQRGGVGRLGQMRHHPGAGEFLGHIPPPGTSLHREFDITPPAGETLRKLPGQMRPVGRRDLPAPNLTGFDIEIVESDLLPVDV